MKKSCDIFTYSESARRSGRNGGIFEKIHAANHKLAIPNIKQGNLNFWISENIGEMKPKTDSESWDSADSESTIFDPMRQRLVGAKIG